MDPAMPQMQLPMLMGILEGKQRARLSQAVEAVERGLEARSIPNVVYDEARGQIARCIETGWDELLCAPYLYGGRWESIPAELASLTDKLAPPPHLVQGYLAKVEAIQSEHPYHRDMRALLLELQPLAHALTQLKKGDMVKKREVRPPVEVVDRYVPPPVRGASQAQVLALLEEVTARNHARMRANFVSLFSNYLASFLADDQAVREEGKAPLEPHRWLNDPRAKTFNPEAYDIVENTTFQTGRGQPYERRDDAEAVIADMAAREADLIRHAFVHKNFGKIASIVDAKGNLAQGEVLGHDLSLSGLQGTLKFSFEDGSSFVVRNAVVWSTSVRGKPFRRFPLTFHDALLPDGTYMHRPDQKGMNETFSTTTTGTVAGSRP
jgi:hypothetical protein